MRLILVGTQRQRLELRDRLADDADVVAEFDSLAEARASGIAADAFLLPSTLTPLVGDDSPLPEPLTAREIEVLAIQSDKSMSDVIAEAVRTYLDARR